MRNGQFYMIGVVLLTSLVFGVVGLQGGVFVTSGGLSSNQVLFGEFKEGIVNTVQATVSGGTNRTEIEQDLSAYLLFQQHVGVSHALRPKTIVLVGRVNETGIDISFGNGWGNDLRSVWISTNGSDRRLGTIADTDVSHVYVSDTTSPVSVSVNSSDVSVERVVQRNSFVIARLRTEQDDAVWSSIITR